MGHPLITVVDGSRVYEGQDVRNADPIYTISNSRLYKGMTAAGAPLATLVNDRIYAGMAVAGAPLATIVGARAYKGMEVRGSPIVSAPSENRITLFAAAYHELKG